MGLKPKNNNGNTQIPNQYQQNVYPQQNTNSNPNQQLMPNGMTMEQYQQMMAQQNQQMQQQMQAQMGQQMGGTEFVPPTNDVYTNEFESDVTPKKKKFPILLIILLVVVVAIVGLIVVKKKQNQDALNEQAQAEQAALLAEQQSSSAYTNLQNALNNFNAYTVDECVGPENADSYLAQEWAYVNEVTLKQEFIQKVCSQVDFINTETDGEVGLVTVSVPDWAQVTESIVDDKDYILQLYKSAGFDEKTDYTFDEDLFKLFCQWLIDRGYHNVALPSKEVVIHLPQTSNATGNRIIADDSELDNALFATDDLHNAMREFSKICVEFTGVGYETYTEKQEVHNPDYDAWYEVFIKYYEADNGKFNPKTSKWEPWYVRDENNNLVLDENGQKIVNYYSVKDENGNDWIQPAETILEDVELQREIEIPWEEERGIPYGIIGTYYIQHDYTGVYDTVFRIGDGSIERPAGFGTPIVTYIKDIDGKYHAVKVALTGYWVEQEAIDYVEAFSDKNRGFTVSSPVQLICFELTIQNLEDEPFAFNTTEMCLCNRNANVSNRTGTLYGFYDCGILEPHKTVKINDWYSSTELMQKYVAWGKSFGRTYPLVYFDCLAGTGDVPSYSAYTQYAGQPEITEANEDY